ncbi:MAG: hypothetical protein ACXVEF_32690 [Polyangiales bacterium]
MSVLTASGARAQPPNQPVEPPPRSYWEPGNPRPFVQTRFDVGVNFGKATVSSGYGLPHWIWVGAEGFAISTTEFGAYYGGIRASSPIVDIAFGYRNNYSYRRTFFAPKERYTSDDTHVDGASHARYLAWELELSGLVPLFGGYAIWAADLDKVIDAPPGVALYEESNRVVIDKSWLIGIRAGYIYPFLKNGMLKIGAVADYIVMPGRPSNVLRVGPVGLLSITDHFEVLGLATLAVTSPDDLGFFLGTWAVACVRYKWATGERNPHFP